MVKRSAKVVFLRGALVGILFMAPAHPVQAAGERTRTYYVAADEVNWDYAPSGRDEAMGHPFDELEKAYTEPGPHRIGRVYKKAIYREYTDGTFSTLKVRPPEEQYLGILGPILRGEVGDTLKIVFKNHASHPYSMHPHGVLYRKDSEGADYQDGTSGADVVLWSPGAAASAFFHPLMTRRIERQQKRELPLPHCEGYWYFRYWFAA